MAKESLAEQVKKEHEALMAERKEAMDKVDEIDKRLAPILAFMNAGKKKEGAKRGRKPKEALPEK